MAQQQKQQHGPTCSRAAHQTQQRPAHGLLARGPSRPSSAPRPACSRTAQPAQQRTGSARFGSYASILAVQRDRTAVRLPRGIKTHRGLLLPWNPSTFLLTSSFSGPTDGAAGGSLAGAVKRR